MSENITSAKESLVKVITDVPFNGIGIRTIDNFYGSGEKESYQGDVGSYNVVSYDRAYEIMVGIQRALREKFPCPECEGRGECNHSSITHKGFCYKCEGSGISMPESE